MTHTISQGPYILRPRDRIFSVDIFSKKWDRIFSDLDRIFSADDRIFSADDRIFSARTVYFRPKTVYFQPGPYILPRPYIFKDRIFYFSGPYILLPNPVPLVPPYKIFKFEVWYLNIMNFKIHKSGTTLKRFPKFLMNCG